MKWLVYLFLTKFLVSLERYFCMPGFTYHGFFFQVRKILISMKMTRKLLRSLAREPQTTMSLDNPPRRNLYKNKLAVLQVCILYACCILKVRYSFIRILGTNEPNAMEEEVESNATNEDNQCPVCAKSFKMAMGLKQHCKTMHDLVLNSDDLKNWGEEAMEEEEEVQQHLESKLRNVPTVGKKSNGKDILAMSKLVVRNLPKSKLKSPRKK